jgi:GDP-4-dehydro-6-deoxy-D-mannose reductase
LSYQVTRSAGLHVVRARPFNHTGPRQSTDYAIPNFAKQIAAIERNAQSPILLTGNLNAERDICDVRDVVRGYTLLMDRGKSGSVYNIASGIAKSMHSVLDGLLSLSKVRVEVREECDPGRAAEASVVCGDPEELRRETGWTPQIPLERTLADTLEYWRQQP